MRLTWIALLSILSLSHSAWAGPHYVLRVERNMPEGREQMALILSSQSSRLTLNSNFIGKRESRTELGSFESKTDENLRSMMADLTQISHRLPTELTSTSASPHRVRVFLGQVEVDPRSTYGKALITMILRARSLEIWKAQQGVRLAFARKDRAMVTRLTSGSARAPSSVKCRPGGETEICKVPGWGTAYLAPN